MKYWIWIVGLYTWIGSAQITTTTFEEVEKLMEIEARPLLVFFYTDSCSYCELMKRKTFVDPDIIQELNEKYYLIFFDGEFKGEVNWKGVKMGFRKRGIKSGTHELAAYFAHQNGVVTYPSLVFLDAQYQKIYQLNTYLKASELHALLKVI